MPAHEGLVSPLILLDNISTDTSGRSVQIPNNGWYVIKIDGNLGSGAITLQTKGHDKDTTWQNVPDPADITNPYTLNEPTQFRIYLGSGMLVRAVLSNSSGASGVYVRIF